MKDEIDIIVPPNYDMEADAQRDIDRMMRDKRKTKKKTKTAPVYKYEKLDRYAGYGILFLSACLLTPILYWIIKNWPV